MTNLRDNKIVNIVNFLMNALWDFKARATSLYIKFCPSPSVSVFLLSLLLVGDIYIVQIVHTDQSLG